MGPAAAAAAAATAAAAAAAAAAAPHVHRSAQRNWSLLRLATTLLVIMSCAAWRGVLRMLPKQPVRKQPQQKHQRTKKPAKVFAHITRTRTSATGPPARRAIQPSALEARRVGGVGGFGHASEGVRS